MMIYELFICTVSVSRSLLKSKIVIPCSEIKKNEIINTKRLIYEQGLTNDDL
jgi:hypothetical protein